MFINLCSEELQLHCPAFNNLTLILLNDINMTKKYICKEIQLQKTKYGYNGIEKYLREPVPPTQHIKPSFKHLCRNHLKYLMLNLLDTKSSQSHKIIIIVEWTIRTSLYDRCKSRNTCF